jgi:hypothetical protein
MVGQGANHDYRLCNVVPQLLIYSNSFSGADVSHAAPDSDRPSITGLVSSVDENFCQYVASCNVQTPREEIIADLQSMVEVINLSISLFLLLT